jgi:hypothetical protein
MSELFHQSILDQWTTPLTSYLGLLARDRGSSAETVAGCKFSANNSKNSRDEAPQPECSEAFIRVIGH